MVSITVQCSNLAAVVGLNPYKSSSEMLESMWYTYSKSTHESAFADATVKDEKKEVELAFDTFENSRDLHKFAAARGKISATAREVSDFKQSVVSDIDEQLKHSELDCDTVRKQAESGDVEAQTKLPDIELNLKKKQQAGGLVKNELRNSVNVNYGTANESKIVEMFRAEGHDVILDKSVFRCTISESPSIRLSGSVDGLIGDDCVLEIKTRVRRLFDKIPIYEKVQLHAYMHALNRQQSMLLQYLRNSQDDFQFATLNLEKDQVFWNDIIVKVKRFGRLLNQVMICSEKARLYVSLSKIERKSWVEDHINHDIGPR